MVNRDPERIIRDQRNRKAWGRRQGNTDVRDIGAIPQSVDPIRRADCCADLRLFLETYFPKIFRLGWSDSHLLLIDSIQKAVFEGGLQAIGYPRGSGKTSVCERAVLWATLFGHSRFAMIFCAEASKSSQRLGAIKKELLTNELLLEDFPEVVYPCAASEGIANRANYQLCKGEPTHLKWGGTELIFPSTPAARSIGNASAVIGVGTMTGSASRGPLVTLPTGGSVRPDLLLIDDPQTRTSAKSPLQTQERLDTITGDMLGMAGPDKAISALLMGTPIYTNDLVDQILDRDKFPDWNGIRVSMLQAWPTAMQKWEEWNDVRCSQGLEAAHRFYERNRIIMDQGASTYWHARVLKGFGSDIESAMYLWYRSPVTFQGEYQCQPEDQLDSEISIPPKEELVKHTSGTKRRRVPKEAEHITAFVDVQQKFLWYMVCGWTDHFTGYIIDYGTWPDQKRRYFTKADARRTMSEKFPGAGFEGMLESALDALINQLSVEYRREDGHTMQIERAFIDANWGDSTDAIYTYLNRNKLAPIWLPSHGIPVTATQNALTDVKAKPGEKMGLNWRLGMHPTRRMKRMLFDANWWKTFVAQRWCTTLGDPGALYIPNDGDHSMMLDHMFAEYAEKVTAQQRGREVIQWTLRPGRDNDLFDCLVGNSVAASTLGCELKAVEAVSRKKRDMQKITSDNISNFYG